MVPGRIVQGPADPVSIEDKSTEAANALRKTREDLVRIARKELEKDLNQAILDVMDSKITEAIENRQLLKKSRVAIDLMDIDRTFADDLDSIVLPKLGDLIHQAAPAPGERSDVGVSGSSNGILLPLVMLFTRIRKNSIKLCGNKIGDGENRRTAGRLAGLTTYYTKHLKKQLETGESPDIT